MVRDGKKKSKKNRAKIEAARLRKQYLPAPK
jgi:hypothetical protein